MVWAHGVVPAVPVVLVVLAVPRWVAVAVALAVPVALVAMAEPAAQAVAAHRLASGWRIREAVHLIWPKYR